MSHVSPALDSNYTPHLRRRDKFGFLVNQGLCQASDETKRMPVHSGSTSERAAFLWFASVSVNCATLLTAKETSCESKNKACAAAHLHSVHNRVFVASYLWG